MTDKEAKSKSTGRADIPALAADPMLSTRALADPTQLAQRAIADPMAAAAIALGLSVLQGDGR